MTILCIYHDHCTDGFAAAWAVRKALGRDVEFCPASYNKPPPDVTGREVLMVDFSYSRPVLEDMIARAETLTVLDHHKTAQQDLEGLNNVRPGVKIIFDMKRSGAGLAWDYFMPHVFKRPWLIDLVEVRDLWRTDDPRWMQARGLHTYLNSWPFTFDEWDRHETISLLEDGQRAMLTEANGILRQHDKEVREIVDITKRRLTIGEGSLAAGVWVACVPPWMASDAGHLLGEGETFAATYYDGPKGRAFSLRSRSDGADVSAIAKTYGGGGHEHAAGFFVPRDHVLARA